MKSTSVTLFLLLLIVTGAIAQETVAPKPRKLQQLYFSDGPTLVLPLSKNLKTGDFGGSLNITGVTQKNKVFRAGILIATIEDNRPITKEFRQEFHDQKSLPIHMVNSLYGATGKKKTINNYLLGQVLAGLSLNYYLRPTNIYRKTSDKGINGKEEFLAYTWENIVVPGALFQAELMAMPGRHFGLTTGAYLHLLPKISHIGIIVSLDVGRLRLKQPEQKTP